MVCHWLRHMEPVDMNTCAFLLPCAGLTAGELPSSRSPAAPPYKFQAVERGGTSVSSAIFTLIRSTARRAGDETHQVQPYGLSRVTARRIFSAFGHGAWLQFGCKRDLPPPSLVHGHAGGGRQMTAGIFEQIHPLLILARPLVKSPQKSRSGSAQVFHKYPLSSVG